MTGSGPRKLGAGIELALHGSIFPSIVACNSSLHVLGYASLGLSGMLPQESWLSEFWDDWDPILLRDGPQVSYHAPIHLPPAAAALLIVQQDLLIHGTPCFCWAPKDDGHTVDNGCAALWDSIPHHFSLHQSMSCG